MATKLASHSLALRPDHLILMLRDIDCDAGVGISEAVAQARDSIAATSGYAVYVEAAQNFIALRVDVEVWDDAPDIDVPKDAWTGPLILELSCPTGNLQVGDDMGNAISEILPPQGPGLYNVAFYHHGRDEALNQEQHLLSLDDMSRLDDVRSGWEGTERYLMQVWWKAPFLEDDLDDDGDDSH